MTKATVEFVKFESADVIATSGGTPGSGSSTTITGIVYGFESGHLYRYSSEGERLYAAYKGDATDKNAKKFWTNVQQNGDTFTYDGGTYSTNDWNDVSKWLIYNAENNSWSIVDRTLQ